MHYHLVRNGPKATDQFAARAGAEFAVRQAVTALTLEKRDQGAAVTWHPLPHGTMLRWQDEFVSGWQVIEATACAVVRSVMPTTSELRLAWVATRVNCAVLRV